MTERDRRTSVALSSPRRRIVAGIAVAHGSNPTPIDREIGIARRTAAIRPASSEGIIDESLEGKPMALWLVT
jgi:hypothetical protein